MIRKVFQIGVLLLLGAGLGIAPAPASAARAAHARLRAVHIATSTEGARVTLDVSRVTSEKLFILHRPYRAVLDLPQTGITRGLQLPSGRGLLADIRMGHRSNGALRLVFVLTAAARVQADWAHSRAHGPQLILTLGDAPAALPAAAASSGMRAAADAIPTPIRARHEPANTGRDIIVAVDAGHGGVDPGAIGPHGLEEKNVTLAIARLLARRIDEQRGMRAVLTRDSDIFIPLRQRMVIARRAKADLFVSVHADDVSQRDIAGASVYILSLRGASSEAARWLAERENDADLKGGVKLDDKSSTLASVLLNLSQSATISESMTAARQVLVSLDQSVPVRKPVVQQAAFVVLKSPDIPSMLIETDYISDPREERRLHSRSHQRRIADAIFRGVRVYFRQHPPAGTLFAEERREGLQDLVAGN
ncbi:MAG TPA: N-acetylmuramoyl-L-alanine amidase [Steroidobacteraceae bacterium]|nr:N-acetylmuramoyl-L-alanine amidase [Steroidobacteraceae bacterium]